jgi:hypothetical protein
VDGLRCIFFAVLWGVLVLRLVWTSASRPAAQERVYLRWAAHGLVTGYAVGLAAHTICLLTNEVWAAALERHVAEAAPWSIVALMPILTWSWLIGGVGFLSTAFLLKRFVGTNSPHPS